LPVYADPLALYPEVLAKALTSLQRLSPCSICWPITVFAAASDEAFVVYAVVDRPIGHPAARIRRQEMDDIVLGQGQADVGIVPICPPDIRVKDELAADHEIGRGRSSRRLRRSGQTPCLRLE
jgi:hypothetical protein